MLDSEGQGGGIGPLPIGRRPTNAPQVRLAAYFNAAGADFPHRHDIPPLAGLIHEPTDTVGPRTHRATQRRVAEAGSADSPLILAEPCLALIEGLRRAIRCTKEIPRGDQWEGMGSSPPCQ